MDIQCVPDKEAARANSLQKPACIFKEQPGTSM